MSRKHGCSSQCQKVKNESTIVPNLKFTSLNRPVLFPKDSIRKASGRMARSCEVGRYPRDRVTKRQKVGSSSRRQTSRFSDRRRSCETRTTNEATRSATTISLGPKRRSNGRILSNRPERQGSVPRNGWPCLIPLCTSGCDEHDYCEVGSLETGVFCDDEETE